MNYDFDLAKVTTDDIIWRLSKAIPAGFYTSLRWIRDKQGLVAAKEYARSFGYESAREMYGRFRARVGAPLGEPITPEQFAEYQDVAHTMMGVDMVHAYAGFDHEKAWVSRKRCLWGGSSPFSNAPADLAGLCSYLDLGFAAAYREHQPRMISRHVFTMADPTFVGARDVGVCGSVMYMSLPEGLPERTPRDRTTPPMPGSPNTLRMADRHGIGEPVLATLPLYAAVQTMMYDRDSELVLIEDGISLPDPAVGGAIDAEGWPSVVELFEQAGHWGVEILACSGCAQARGLSGSTELAPFTVWVDAHDIRLATHSCAPVPPEGLPRFTHEKQSETQEKFVQLVSGDGRRVFS